MRKTMFLVILVAILMVVSGCKGKEPVSDGSNGGEPTVMPEPGADGTADDSGASASAGGSPSQELSDLAKAMTSGKDYKCTAKIENTVSTFWISKGKEKIETQTPQGNANTIIDGKMMYVWMEGATTGMKYNIDEMKELTSGSTAPAGQQTKTPEDYNENAADVKCSATSVPASKFVPPSGIEWQDMVEMMKQLQEMSGKLQGMNVPTQ